MPSREVHRNEALNLEPCWSTVSQLPLGAPHNSALGDFIAVSFDQPLRLRRQPLGLVDTVSQGSLGLFDDAREWFVRLLVHRFVPTRTPQPAQRCRSRLVPVPVTDWSHGVNRVDPPYAKRMVGF